MTAAPTDWFEVLAVNPDDVTRVGYSLAEYADDHEAIPSRQTASQEQILRQATTLAEAASLVILVDSVAGRALFARAAQLLETTGHPECWTLGLAANGAWRPSSNERRRGTVAEPTDAMADLVALYSDQEYSRRPRSGAWRAAAEFQYRGRGGWSSTGAPARFFSELAGFARERNVDEVMRVLDRITGRCDEAITFVQKHDAWHWRRFSSDLTLLDPELLALGVLLSRVDGDIAPRLQERSLTPARVAVLVGMSAPDTPAENLELG